MQVGEIRRVLQAQPFRPFTINMSDGRSLSVRHPEMLAILMGLERTVVLAVPGEEAVQIIDLLHVSSLTIGENGKKTGRKAG